MTTDGAPVGHPTPMKIVLLVGAGASVPLGLPDTRHFLRRMTGLSQGLRGVLGRIKGSHPKATVDIDWVLDRLDMYKHVDRLVRTDRNLAAEAKRAVADVLKQCQDEAERLRAAFPKREYLGRKPHVGAFTNLATQVGHLDYSPTTFPSTLIPSASGAILDRSLAALPEVLAPLSATGAAGVPSAAGPSSPQTPESEYREVKAPSFRPPVEPDTASQNMFADIVKDAELLRDAIYENILRVYNSVEPSQVQQLYEPFLTPLWRLCESRSATPMNMFTTNWDPAFHALKDGSGLPIELGIAFKAYEQGWDPNVYREHTINVYHLHGCCRWLKSDSEPVRILYNAVPKLRTEGYSVPVIYQPSTKASQISEEPYATAYAALQSAASTPAVWIVIGYSFRDQPIQRLLDWGAAKGTIHKLIVLDPAAKLPYPAELAENNRVLHIHDRFGDPEVVESVLAAMDSALSESASAEQPAPDPSPTSAPPSSTP